MTRMLIGDRKLLYDQKFLEEWKRGRIQKKWRKKYSSIFDADDLKLATSQKKYHLGEWFAAKYFADEGYKVLVEKYIHPSHRRKFQTMKKHWPDVLNYLRHLRRGHNCQPPDLFVYKGKEFHFVEVKRDKDFERSNQKKMFKILSKNLKVPVHYYYVLQKNEK